MAFGDAVGPDPGAGSGRRGQSNPFDVTVPGSTSIAPVMTRFGQNSLEVAVAVGTIMVGTVIMHLIVSWLIALAALI